MMNEKRETITDIVEAMRGRGEDGRMDMSLWRDYADRIEASWKRELAKVEADALEVGGIIEAARTAEKSSAFGNAATMREAVVAMVEAETEGSMDRDDLCGRCFEKMWNSCKHDGSCWVDKVINALANPPRNCDVGTAEEQSERFMDFCRPGNRPPNCEDCKVYPKRMNKFWCQLEWAQMPYEAKEGGAKC